MGVNVHGLCQPLVGPADRAALGEELRRAMDDGGADAGSMCRQPRLARQSGTVDARNASYPHGRSRCPYGQLAKH